MEPYSGHTPKFPHRILSELPNTGAEFVGGLDAGDILLYALLGIGVGVLIEWWVHR